MQTRTIAVVGASADRAKYGNKCVRAYAAAGWEVFPVHPRETEIEGLRAYGSLAEVPVELDRISLYLPPAVTATLVPEMAAKGAREVWFNPGAADATVLAAARRAGLSVRSGCSILDIGMSPARFR